MFQLEKSTPFFCCAAECRFYLIVRAGIDTQTWELYPRLGRWSMTTLCLSGQSLLVTATCQHFNVFLSKLPSLSVIVDFFVVTWLTFRGRNRWEIITGWRHPSALLLLQSFFLFCPHRQPGGNCIWFCKHGYFSDWNLLILLVKQRSGLKRWRWLLASEHHRAERGYGGRKTSRPCVCCAGKHASWCSHGGECSVSSVKWEFNDCISHGDI